MNIKATLPIFFNTDETSTFNECGIDYSLSKCDIRDVMFLNINAISRYFDDEKEYSLIHSNGDKFICCLTMDDIKLKLGI